MGKILVTLWKLRWKEKSGSSHTQLLNYLTYVQLLWFLWRMTIEGYAPTEVNQRTQAVFFQLSQKTAGGLGKIMMDFY